METQTPVPQEHSKPKHWRCLAWMDYFTFFAGRTQPGSLPLLASANLVHSPSGMAPVLEGGPEAFARNQHRRLLLPRSSLPSLWYTHSYVVRPKA